MEATMKSEGIDSFITKISGKNRIKTISENECMTCLGEADYFRDELSKKEYRISGMCQDCQDRVFGK